MGRVSGPGLQRLKYCCEKIYRWDEEETQQTFAEHAVGLLPKLLRGSVAAFQSFHFPTQTTELVLSAREKEVEREAGAFYAHLHEHPLIERARATGCTESLRITDVVPWSTFERTGLYNEFYKKVGLGPQVAASLPAGKGEVVGLVMTRDKGDEDFSEEDCALLDLFRLHVLQAREIAREMSGLNARLRRMQEMLEVLEEGVVSLNAALKVCEWSARARGMLEKHFGRMRGQGLPAEVEGWVKAQVSANTAGKGPGFAVVMQTAAGRLRLHLARRAGTWMLVLQEPAGPRQVAAHVKAKLTRRESEVLEWIGRGKMNPEIAIILGTSPRTVQKHVEHILAKLQVENRHAAAVMAMEFSC
jgi:DNA-binding CsgD family transcriptional regulator